MYQLHVRVVEARDLDNFDGIDRSDPYCILRVNGMEQRTNFISNNNNPVWNQEFHFSVPTPQAGALEIRMKDKDGGLRGRDDDMSTLCIQFGMLPVGQVLDNWYPMTSCKGNKRGGTLHLILHMAPMGTPPFAGAPVMGGYPQGGYGYPGAGCYPPGPSPYGPPGYPPRGYPAPPPGPYGPPGYPPCPYGRPGW